MGLIVDVSIRYLTLIKYRITSLTKWLEFEKSLKEEFNKKIAKNLVWFLEWQIEKSTQAIKQDPTIRSRMIIALENIVNSEIKSDS